MKLFIFALAVSAVCASSFHGGVTYKPSCQKKVYCDSKLLHYVQMARLFPDSKTFVDLHMRFDEDTVMRAFDDLLKDTKNEPSKADLQEFVDYFFDSESGLETWTPTDFKSEPAFLSTIRDPQLRQFAKNVNNIWPTLGRKMKPMVFENSESFSMIPVHNGFIIPGGRFREFYYWDTYWIIEGLLISGMTETVKGMLSNFIELQRQFGHIPNGARWYYQERSQPPLLSAMMSIYLQETNDVEFLRANIDVLESELEYWLDTHSVVFEVAGKEYSLLRYYAPSVGPRPESYYEDYTTAQAFETEQRQKQFYTDIKSAAESGWDFSSRWFISKDGGNKGNLTSIHTTDIVPVDLNAIFANAMQNIAHFYNVLRDNRKGAHWLEMNKRWINTIEDVFWNEEDGIWYDWDLHNSQHRKFYYPSNIAPLWMEAVKPEFVRAKSQKILSYMKKTHSLEYPGGVPTSLIRSGEQWDFPNAWPPLVSMVVSALEALQTEESNKLAFEVAQTWVRSNYKGYLSNKQLYEKYDVESPGKVGSGGEYTTQDGFGWTNGAVLEMLAKYGPTMTAVHGYVPFHSKYPQYSSGAVSYTQSFNSPNVDAQPVHITPPKPTVFNQHFFNSFPSQPKAPAKPVYFTSPPAKPTVFTQSTYLPSYPTKPEYVSAPKPEYVVSTSVKPEYVETKPVFVSSVKPQSPETKPEHVETKPEHVETKPEYFETKPENVETKPVFVSSVKPQLPETKPEYVEIKPEIVLSIKPQVPETKPEYVETKPVFVSSVKPQLPETKPEYVETKPVLVASAKPELPETKPEFVLSVKPDTKPQFDETKPEYVATKPEYVETKPEYVATKPFFISSVKPQLPATKPEFVPSVKPELPATKPEYVEAKPVFVTSVKPQFPETKPEYVETKPVFVSSAKPQLPEAKPEFVLSVKPDTKPQFDETKPEHVATKPFFIASIKPQIPETKPEIVPSVKPELPATKPEYVEAKPVFVSSVKPQFPETKPEYVETKPVFISSAKPQLPETKPEFVLSVKPDTKPQFDETKPEYVATKPEYVETKPEYVATKPFFISSVKPQLPATKPEFVPSVKPELPATKPEYVEAKPVFVTSVKPQFPETKPEYVETKPVFVSSVKPQLPETKPEYVETKPVFISSAKPQLPETKPEFVLSVKPDTKPQFDETKPEYVATKPEYVETKPEYVATKPLFISSVKPQLPATKPEFVPSVKPELPATKPQFVEAKPEFVVSIKPQFPETKPEYVEAKPVFVSSAKPQLPEAKPEFVLSVKPDTKPQFDETKPEYVATKPFFVSSVKPQLPETKPEIVPSVKPELPATKPEFVEAKPEFVQNKPYEYVKPGYTPSYEKPAYVESPKPTVEFVASTTFKPEYVSSYPAKPLYDSPIESKPQYIESEKPDTPVKPVPVPLVKPESASVGYTKPFYIPSIPVKPIVEFKPEVDSAVHTKPSYVASKPEFVSSTPYEPEYIPTTTAQPSKPLYVSSFETKPTYVVSVEAKPTFNKPGYGSFVQTKPEFVSSTTFKPEPETKPQYVANAPIKPAYITITAAKPEFVASYPAKPSLVSSAKPEFVTPAPAKPDSPAKPAYITLTETKPEYVAPSSAKPLYSSTPKPDFVAPVKPAYITLTSVQAKPDFAPSTLKPEAKPTFEAHVKPEYVLAAQADFVSSAEPKPESPVKPAYITLTETKPEYVAPSPAKPLYSSTPKPDFVAPAKPAYITLTSVQAKPDLAPSTVSPIDKVEYATQASFKPEYTTTLLDSEYSSTAAPTEFYTTTQPEHKESLTPVTQATPVKPGYVVSIQAKPQVNTLSINTASAEKPAYSTIAPHIEEDSKFTTTYTTSAPTKFPSFTEGKPSIVFSTFGKPEHTQVVGSAAPQEASILQQSHFTQFTPGFTAHKRPLGHLSNIPVQTFGIATAPPKTEGFSSVSHIIVNSTSANNSPFAFTHVTVKPEYAFGTPGSGFIFNKTVTPGQVSTVEYVGNPAKTEQSVFGYSTFGRPSYLQTGQYVPSNWHSSQVKPIFGTTSKNVYFTSNPIKHTFSSGQYQPQYNSGLYRNSYVKPTVTKTVTVSNPATVVA